MHVPQWLSLLIAVAVIGFGAYRLWYAVKGPSDEERAKARRGMMAMPRRTHGMVGVIYLLVGAALLATSFGFNPFAKEAAPKVSRIAVLWDGDKDHYLQLWQPAVERAARELGVGARSGAFVTTEGELSARFAELLQRSSMASLADRYPDVPNGGVKRAGFYVLAGARMPAALFETAFISNPQGEARLNNGDFRQRMADAIVNAIRAYREGL